MRLLSRSFAPSSVRIRSIPWIKYVNAQTLKVSYIAGDNDQIVFQGRCRNESIRHFERPAFQFALSGQETPSLGNRFIYRQDPKPPALLISDVIMPGMNGIDLAIRFKTISTLESLVTI